MTVATGAYEPNMWRYVRCWPESPATFVAGKRYTEDMGSDSWVEVAHDAVVHDEARLGHGVIVGPGSVVGRGAVLKPGTRLWGGPRIPSGRIVAGTVDGLRRRKDR